MASIASLLEKHTSTRLNSLNLIVSENRMSQKAQAVLNTDIQSRYAADFYAGTYPAQEIISAVTELTKKVFKTKFANISPVSGNLCVLAVTMSLSKPNDLIARIPPFIPGGGYPFQYNAFDREILSLPFDMDNWQIDIEGSISLLRQKKPLLVVLGPSIFIYPVPVKEIAEVVHSYGGLVAFDGSHPLGLIAGGQYQDPLSEGADLLFGSTHKTLPGPQGGIIVTNDEEIHKRIQVYSNFKPLDGPSLICNPHLARIASTGIVLEETPLEDYARQVVKNSQVIANTLHEEEIPLHGVSNTDYPELTYSHQVLPNFPLEDRIELRNYLTKNRILTDGFNRIGTSEITRLGFKEEECRKLGKIIASLFRKDETKLSEMQEELSELINSHQSVLYCSKPIPQQ